MKAHVKDNAVSVMFADDDDRDLTAAVKLERLRLKDVRYGKATLIRDLVMPRVREILAAASDASKEFPPIPGDRRQRPVRVG